jgi:hypothetical protein
MNGCFRLVCLCSGIFAVSAAASPAAAQPRPTISDFPSPPATGPARVVRQPFGQLNGEPVDLFILTNESGMVVKIISYGARVAAIRTPDREGKWDDVVLGYDTLADYTAPSHRGEGNAGFDRVIWREDPTAGLSGAAIRLVYSGPAGDPGYPGNCHAAATYRLTDDDEVRIEYEVTADAPTPLNLTNHTYFNLNGAGEGDVLGHELMLHALQYLPADAALIPTGELKSVIGTPLDFTHATRIGLRLKAAGGDPVGQAALGGAGDLAQVGAPPRGLQHRARRAILQRQCVRRRGARQTGASLSPIRRVLSRDGASSRFGPPAQFSPGHSPPRRHVSFDHALALLRRRRDGAAR